MDADSLEAAFHEAVDDYLATCAELVCVEIKSSKTVAPDMFKALKKWQDVSSSTAEPLLVSGGEGACLRSGVRVAGWCEMLGGREEY